MPDMQGGKGGQSDKKQKVIKAKEKHLLSTTAIQKRHETQKERRMQAAAKQVSYQLTQLSAGLPVSSYNYGGQRRG